MGRGRFVVARVKNGVVAPILAKPSISDSALKSVWPTRHRTATFPKRCVVLLVRIAVAVARLDTVAEITIPN